MINTRDVEEVLLRMAVGEKKVHGDKTFSRIYDSLAIKYGVVRKCTVNTYSPKTTIRWMSL